MSVSARQDRNRGELMPSWTMQISGPLAGSEFSIELAGPILGQLLEDAIEALVTLGVDIPDEPNEPDEPDDKYTPVDASDPAFLSWLGEVSTESRKQRQEMNQRSRADRRNGLRLHDTDPRHTQNR